MTTRQRRSSAARSESAPASKRPMQQAPATPKRIRVGEYELEKTEPTNGGQVIRMTLFKPGGKVTGDYIIAYNPDGANEARSLVPGWSCSCMGWKMEKNGRRYCKHLTALRSTLVGE